MHLIAHLHEAPWYFLVFVLKMTFCSFFSEEIGAAFSPEYAILGAMIMVASNIAAINFPELKMRVVSPDAFPGMLIFFRIER